MRFILDDGISTLPNGNTFLGCPCNATHHRRARLGKEEDEEMSTSRTCDERNGNNSVTAVTPIFAEKQQNAQVEIQEPEEIFTRRDMEPIVLTKHMIEAWSLPDPWFIQREYSESEVKEGVLNLDESFEEQSPPRNPFNDDEAAEVTDAEEPTHEYEKESDPNDCEVVAQVAEDETNGVDFSEYLNDFDNCFSDNEIVNRIKRTKKTHGNCQRLELFKCDLPVLHARCIHCVLLLLWSTCSIGFK